MSLPKRCLRRYMPELFEVDDPPSPSWSADHPWDVNRIVRTRTGWAPADLRELERQGCITHNEAREMKGLPAIPGGEYMDVVDDIIGEPDVIRGDDCGPLFGATTRQAMQPFAYGLAFLLLLWGCMAWEKWIGWVTW